MNKDLDVNVEMGLCTTEMAKENPIKDFEILIEEYKDKWSKQMYNYFKACLNVIKKELIRKQKLEKAIELFHEKCDFVYNPEKKMWQFDNMEYFDKKEFNLVKDLVGRR